MKTSAIAFALLACCLLPASGQGEAPGSALRLSGDLSASLGLAGENEASFLHGQPGYEEVAAVSELNATLTFSPSYTTLGLLDLSLRDSNLLSHADGSLLESLSLVVNQFYADLNHADLLYLRAGKQRLKWGAGWVLNPSDPVNPPKDPTADRQTAAGVPALKAELITRRVSFAVFGTVYDRLEDFGVGGKVSSSALAGADLSLSGYWSRSSSWTAAANLSVAPLYALPGWDTIQLWFEGGLYGQPRYPALNPVAAPAGLQHALLAGVSGSLPVVRTALLAEYYHLSEGLSAGEESVLFAALRAATADPAALARRPARLGRNYAFLSVTQPSLTDSGHPVFDHIGLSSSLLLNLTDLSLLARHGLSSTFVPDSELNLGVAWTAGGRDSEFGNLWSALILELELKIFY